jgi:hypothetical protein
VVPSVGDPDLNISYGEKQYYENRIGRDEIILCPPLTNAVIEISVYSYASVCTYDLLVTEYPLAVAPLLNIVNHYILTYDIGDGVDTLISSIYDTYIANNYLFRVQSLNLSCGLHVESRGNNLLSFLWNGIEYDVTPYTYSGRSYFDVSICQTDLMPDSSLSFQASVSDVQFEVFVTTSNLTDTVPLHSLYLRDALDMLSSDIYISLPSTLPCGITNVWSSLSSSPFNPPLDFLFSANASFNEINWTLPTTATGDNRAIYTYLLVDEEYVGSAEDIMNIFQFSIGPGLMDGHGARLAGSEPISSAVKSNITCDNPKIDELLEDLNIVLEYLVSLDESKLSDAYSAFVQSDIIQSNLTWIACGKQIEIMNGSNTIENVELCGDWNCTSLILNNYILETKLINNGACLLTANILIDPNIDASWYKGCKESVYSVTTGKTGRPCVSDDDCGFPWAKSSNMMYETYNGTCYFDTIVTNGSQCDTFVGKCSDTQEEAEDIFWWCFVQNMSLDVQMTLSFQGFDICNSSNLKSSFSSNDCISLSGTGMDALQYRSHYQYVTHVTLPLIDETGVVDDPVQDHCDCLQSVGSEYDLCLDQLCNKPPPCEYTVYDHAPSYLLQPSETPVKSDACSYSLVYQGNDTAGCLAEYQCNWNPSIIGNLSDVSACVNEGASDKFCGIHFNIKDALYHEVVNVSESECGLNGGKMCVTPFGSVLVGELSNDICTQNGYCTVDCPTLGKEECLPVDRRKSSMCFNNSDMMSEILCQQLSGQWLNGNEGFGENICLFPLQNNQPECKQNGNVFIDCQSLSHDECDSNGYLLCYLTNTSSMCQTKDDCEHHGVGQCSDSKYFVNYLTSPPMNGSCVIPFELDTSMSPTRQYCYRNTIPLSFGYALSSFEIVLI